MCFLLLAARAVPCDQPQQNYICKEGKYSRIGSPVASTRPDSPDLLLRPDSSIHLNSCASSDTSQEDSKEMDDDNNYSEHEYNDKCENDADQPRKQVNNYCATESPLNINGFGNYNDGDEDNNGDKDNDGDEDNDTILSICKGSVPRETGYLRNCCRKEKASFSGKGDCCKPNIFSRNINKKDSGDDCDCSCGSHFKSVGVVNLSFDNKSLYQGPQPESQCKKAPRRGSKGGSSHGDCGYGYNINEMDNCDCEALDVDRIPSCEIMETLDNLSLSMSEETFQKDISPVKSRRIQSARVIRTSSEEVPITVTITQQNRKDLRPICGKHGKKKVKSATTKDNHKRKLSSGTPYKVEESQRGTGDIASYFIKHYEILMNKELNKREIVLFKGASEKNKAVSEGSCGKSNSGKEISRIVDRKDSGISVSGSFTHFDKKLCN